ncbi:MAG TPA: two-component regulator propeller domain-containing protein, partial [Bacteroidia bacterium]
MYFVNDTIGQTPLLQHYTIQDGLPSNKVYCAIRDRRGFAWLATDNGLVRFDGSSFKIYTVKDGLPDNDVFTVFEDNKGKVWVLTSKQTPCFFLDDKLYTAANDTFLAKYFNDPDRYRFTVNPYLKRLMFFVIWEEHYTAVEYGQPP